MDDPQELDSLACVMTCTDNGAVYSRPGYDKDTHQ